jgi:hypothetical protein
MKIEFIAKILPCDLPAQSGDVIPRPVLEGYINSPECKSRLSKGLITGGVTHFSRKTEKEGIPNADQILLDGNQFFKATDVWMDGNFAMAKFEVFMNLHLEGEIKNTYNSFVNALKNNIKYPVSSCLRAFWDDVVCKEIVFLRGVDITLQPGFHGSEIVDIIITE